MTWGRASGRPAGRVCMAALAAATVAACGSSQPTPSAVPSGSATAGPTASPPTSTPAPSTPTPAGPSGPAECTNDQLAGVMVTQQGAAGTAQGGFEVRDTAPVACTLQGYFGVQMAAASGQMLQSSYSLLSAPTPLVVLRPNTSPLNSGNDQGHAIFYMRWSEICQGTPSNQPARWLFTPPHLSGTFTVSTTVVNPPSGSVIVCDGHLRIGPVSPPGSPAPS